MTLNLNVGVGINPDFLNYSLAERKIIINLGLLAYKELNTKIYSFSHNSKLEQSLTQKLDQEKKQLAQEHQEELQQLEHQHQSRRKQLDQQIDLLQSQLNNQHQHQQYLLDNQKDMYQQIIQQHHQEQSNLQQLLENSLQSLSVHNSTQKGKIGELKIENIINNYFPDYSIQNVSKSPHQGDYHLQNHSHHIMVEIKNYDSEKIRNSQIDKFYYDLDYCQQHHIPINAAIFISLNQGISGKKIIDFEVYKNIPVIYLSNLSSDYDKISLAMALLEKYRQISHMDNQDHQAYLVNFMTGKIGNIAQTTQNLDAQHKIIHDIFTYVKQKYDKYTKEHHKNISYIQQLIQEIEDKIHDQSVSYDNLEQTFLNLSDPADLSKNMLKCIQEKYLAHKLTLQQEDPPSPCHSGDSQMAVASDMVSEGTLTTVDVIEEQVEPVEEDIEVVLQKKIWIPPQESTILKWQEQYPWLQYNPQGILWCQCCQLEFSSNYKKSTFGNHEKSRGHLDKC